MSRLHSYDLPPGEARDRHAHLCEMLRLARREQSLISRMIRGLQAELEWLQGLWDSQARPIRLWELELCKLESRYTHCKPRGEHRAPPRTPSPLERGMGYDEARKIQQALSKLSDTQRDALLKMLGSSED